MRRRYRLFCIALLVAISLALLLLIPVEAWSDALREEVRAAPLTSFILATLALAVWALLLPTAIPIFLLGYAFGVTQGVLVTYLGCSAACSFAFLLARSLGRERVERLLASRPRLAELDRALEDESFRLVVLLRLSPVMPFHVQNYCFGLSRMSLRTCLIATWIGKAPAVLITVLIGAAASGVGHEQGWLSSEAPLRTTSIIIAGLATLALAWWVQRMARRVLRSQGSLEPNSAA